MFNPCGLEKLWRELNSNLTLITSKLGTIARLGNGTVIKLMLRTQSLIGGERVLELTMFGED